MHRHLLYYLAVCAVIIMGITTVRPALAGSTDACALLTPTAIANATGLKVANGTAGPLIPGTLGRCTWLGNGNTKVIVTLTDSQHMQNTMSAQKKAGGVDIPGLGTKAVGIKGAAFAGGGYIISVLDTKGGFGVSVLGSVGTRDLAVALAKLVESHR